MDYTVKNNNIIVHEKDFDLDETLDCGQAFRWKKEGDSYTGYFLNNKLTISQEGETFIFHDTSEKDFLEKWFGYFDFATDYSELKRRFSEDETLAKACEFAGGIRLLRQDSWECLISFIISQNNNIPRIKGIIDRLCEKYGGNFPTSEQLSQDSDLSYLRSGFREKYIHDAAEKVNSGTTDLRKIALLPLDEAREELKRIKGVGAKVSDCVLLFGMHRTDAFPVDVWIKRVTEKFYPNGLPKCMGKEAGIAQQYLFHYIRTNSLV